MLAGHWRYGLEKHAISSIYPFMGTEFERLENSAGEAQRLTALVDALRSAARDVGATQLPAMLTIALNPGISINELAEKLDMPQQSASRIIGTLSGRYQDLLEPSSEFVEIRFNSTDPRRKAIFLSEAGRRIVNPFIALLGEA